MALETRRERIIYLGVIPIVGAVLGALAAAIFQIMSSPTAGLPSAVEVLRDQFLSSADKIRLLEMIKEVGDRPWSLLRSLFFCLTFLVGVRAPAIAQRIRDR
jgi:hypothetical protein